MHSCVTTYSPDRGVLTITYRRIVAAATINFGLARVRLLIKHGVYYFLCMSLGAIDKNSDTED